MPEDTLFQSDTEPSPDISPKLPLATIWRFSNLPLRSRSRTLMEYTQGPLFAVAKDFPDGFRAIPNAPGPVAYSSPSGAMMRPPGRMEAPPFRIGGRTPAGAIYDWAARLVPRISSSSDKRQTANTLP